MADKCGAHSHRNEPDPVTPAAWSDGQRYWRSLDELSGSPKFWEKIHREFPRYASEWTDDLSRRSFLKVMGASIALAGTAGCFKKPQQQIVPYVNQPEMITPGIPLHFATALPIQGYARGVLVRSDEGRPNKIEGNPQHPASLGATDSQTQAALLELYDPDRSQSVINVGIVSSWDNLYYEPQNGIAAKLDSLKASGGKGLVVMTDVITSPTFGAVMSYLLKNLPQAKWFRHSPVNRDNAAAGAELAFGKDRRNVRPVFKFDQADVVLTLDGNFLADDPGSLAYARQFTDRRRVRDKQRSMNRLYAVEGTYSISGAMADHRLAVKPSHVEAVARAIAAGVGMAEAAGSENLLPGEAAFAKAVAADLSAHAGSSLVVVGDSQPPAVHALAHAINERLGNVGKTVNYIQSPEVLPGTPWESLDELAKAMDSGDVEMLLILESNPVYAKPAEVDFAAALKKFSVVTQDGKPGGKPRYITVRQGLYEDETSLLCQWHLPATHPLEHWADLAAFDGTISICQPLINPLYEGRSPLALLNWFTSKLVTPLAGQGSPTGLETDYDIVRAYWRTQAWQGYAGDTDFDIFWETSLFNGFVPKTAATALDRLPIAAGALAASASAASEGMEIIFLPDPHIGDGRYANNGWLQELPKPICKLVWDNAVLLSIATAAQLKVNNDDLVELSVGGRKLGGERVAVWIVPGHADNCATVYLGYGRERGGRVAADAGFNAYTLRTVAAPCFAGGLQIAKGNGSYQLVTTQGSQSMEGRDLIKVGVVEHAYAVVEEEDKKEDEELAAEAKAEGIESLEQDVKSIRHPLPVFSMYPETPDHESGLSVDPKFQAWGMVIDNNTCIGCNACVIACQAENNIPVVGKDQVGRGREMHWLRIDTYFTGPLDKNGTPADGPQADAYDASTNRNVAPGGQGLGSGNAGRDKEGVANSASDVHAYFEPVPCMHCEKAPCEVVCPVGATLHDSEGLNQMVYNRCVGTRYCSNNCPYKVRRFNFFLYADLDTKSLALGRNPDVTVRTRGVMEKCTYCIQRISSARIKAKKNWNNPDGSGFDANGKPTIPDGSFQTACQQVCPTRAIAFGDIGDETSEVRKLKEEPLNYVLLEELQTRPRTSYLWRLTNPNPDLAKA